jgi:hypothetical protein
MISVPSGEDAIEQHDGIFSQASFIALQALASKVSGSLLA